MGGGDEIRLLVHHEDESGQETRLGGAGTVPWMLHVMLCCIYSQVWHEELYSSWCPDSPAQSLSNLHKPGPVALDGSDGDHDDVGVREQLGRVGHSIVDFFGSVRRQWSENITKATNQETVQ